MKILRNPLYTGIIFLPKWGLKQRGSFEPIVSQEVFARTQQKLSGKSVASVPHRKVNPSFPLRVFVRCAHCSTPLTGSVAKGRYAYYFCRNKDCRNLSVPVEKMERAFVSLLLRSQWEPEYANFFDAIVRDVWEMRREHARVSLATATKRVADLTERKNLLVEALLYRKITQHVYDEQIDRLEQDLALAEMSHTHAKMDDLEVETVLSYARHVMGTWPDCGWTRPFKARSACNVDSFQKV